MSKQEIFQVTFPAKKYYAMGRMHYEKGRTHFQTPKYELDRDGVRVEAYMIGPTKDNMREVYSKVAYCKCDPYIEVDEFDQYVYEIEQTIKAKITDYMVPSEENMQVARRIWKRDIADSLDEALASLMICGRYSPKERRYLAHKLLECGKITLRQLVNFRDNLMIY